MDEMISSAANSSKTCTLEVKLSKTFVSRSEAICKSMKTSHKSDELIFFIK